MNDTQMWQWWTVISERERREIVSGIRGCMEYGCTVSPHKLPEAAKLAVRDAYARHLKVVADLEAKYPSA